MTSGEAKGRRGSRLQLMNCSTPMTSPCGVFIATTSIEVVRYPIRASNSALMWKGDSGGKAYASSIRSTSPDRATYPATLSALIGSVDSLNGTCTLSFCATLKRRHWLSSGVFSTT